MEVGDLIRCREGYFEKDASPRGIIIEDLGVVPLGHTGLPIREFNVLFQDYVQKMYEYEMQVINAG